MPKQNELHIFEGDLKEFEKGLIEYIVGSRKLKRRPEIESHILAYLIFHQSLTQKQIRDLSLIYYKKSARKGISNGSISSVLNQFIKWGAVKKTKLESKKDTYLYSVHGDIRQFFAQSHIIVLKYYNQMSNFFNQKLHELNRLSSNGEKDINSYTILSQRVSEMLKVLNFLIQFMEVDTNSKKEITSDEIKIKEKQENGLIGSNRNIEKEIIEFLIKAPLFVLEKPSYTQILAYFCTRKQLTQKQIKELTNLSTGQISQALSHLLEQNYIQFRKVKGERQTIYTMNSFKYSALIGLYKALQASSEGRIRLKKIYQELEKREGKLRSLHGYFIIKEKLKQLIDVMPIYQEALDKLERFMKN